MLKFPPVTALPLCVCQCVGGHDGPTAAASPVSPASSCTLHPCESGRSQKTRKPGGPGRHSPTLHHLPRDQRYLDQCEVQQHVCFRLLFSWFPTLVSSHVWCRLDVSHLCESWRSRFKQIAVMFVSVTSYLVVSDAVFSCCYWKRDMLKAFSWKKTKNFYFSLYYRSTTSSILLPKPVMMRSLLSQ